ncbi:MAG TPA: CotH kinase family protein [Polyangiaceae bacterium]|nr:CotH kinase family protein [Polyangiaceae bacterium]
MRKRLLPNPSSNLPLANLPRTAILLVAAAGVLTLSACEDNYITNKYYFHPDAGPSSSETSSSSTDGDASAPDASTEGETSSPSETSSAPTSDEQDAGAETETPDASSATGETTETTSDTSSDAGGSEDASVPRGPFYDGAPQANTDKADFDIDVFGAAGNRYWFATDPAQVDRMNGAQNGGGPIVFGNNYGDIYTPGGEGSKTYVESFFATNPAGQTADFGKIQVRVVGQSTLRPWTADTIPNLRLDMDQFIKKQRIDGYEHLRFNNGLVGTIFREKLTLDLYKALGYPAPKANFAWVGSNVWGPNLWVPYTVVEVYKKGFCHEWPDQMGDGCVNIWEFQGDVSANAGIDFSDPNNCQVDECDGTRADEMAQLIAQTPQAAGFKDALASYLDWDSFHRFQCLSWILATGDDALHNQNNVVLAERADGMFQFLPYSVDISLGQDWYSSVALPGTNSVALGCQNDPDCWADTVATCEQVLDAFTALDPKGMLDDTYNTLQSQGMLRPGDEQRYTQLGKWFDDRLVALPVELEDNRDAPQLCTDGMVWCNGYCDYPENCYLCQPPVVGKPVGQPGDIAPVPDPVPVPVGDAGVPVEGDGGGVIDPGGPVVCPMVEAYKLAK